MILLHDLLFTSWTLLLFSTFYTSLKRFQTFLASALRVRCASAAFISFFFSMKHSQAAYREKERHHGTAPTRCGLLAWCLSTYPVQVKRSGMRWSQITGLNVFVAFHALSRWLSKPRTTWDPPPTRDFYSPINQITCLCAARYPARIDS